MKTSHRLMLTLILLAGGAAAAFAEEGSLRERLKERRAQKQAPVADIDAKITKPGDYTFSLTRDGIERKYRVHVPAAYDSAKPGAVLVALHGGGGDMNYQASDEHYGLISKSDREGFIAVFPNGYSKRSSGKLATWNAGSCCGNARDEKVDDVGFIKDVVAHVRQQLNVDGNRIFATGMSNGAMMSYRLACELSDTFSGIAAVAGTDGTMSCQPKRPISVLHIHAKNDDHVLFNGGAGPGAFRDSTKVADFTSVPATVAKWMKLNHCDATPKRVLEKPGVYCERYSSCDGGTKVELCVTDTGAHSWPGGTKRRGGEPASTAISADDVMWEFFTGK